MYGHGKGNESVNGMNLSGSSIKSLAPPRRQAPPTHRPLNIGVLDRLRVISHPEAVTSKKSRHYWKHLFSEKTISRRGVSSPPRMAACGSSGQVYPDIVMGPPQALAYQATLFDSRRQFWSMGIVCREADPRISGRSRDGGCHRSRQPASREVGQAVGWPGGNCR